MRQPLLFKKIELKKLYSKIIYVALVFLFWAKAVLSQGGEDLLPLPAYQTAGLPETPAEHILIQLTKVGFLILFSFPVALVSALYFFRFLVARIRKKPEAVWLLRKSGLWGLLFASCFSTYQGLNQLDAFLRYNQKPFFSDSFAIPEFQIAYAYFVVAICIFIIFISFTRKYKKARAVEKATAKQVAPKVTDPPPSA